MKKKTTTLALSLLLSLSATAQLPNAGSISRDVAQKADTPPPQAVVSREEMATQADPSDGIELEVNRIQLLGVESLNSEQFQPLVASLEGKTVTLGEVRAVAARITSAYQEAGFQLARAFIPPQKILDGVLTIQVVEGQIAGVTADNRSRLKTSVLDGYLANAYTAGKPLQRGQSERALLLIRDLAGVGEVNYRLSEGQQPGETLLLADVEKAPLVSGQFSVENYGSQSTGEYRTRANVNLNGLFGVGEHIALQGMSSFKGVNNGRASLALPLGYRGLQLNTSVAHTNYTLGGAFKTLNAKGTANTVDYSLRYPLLRTNEKSLWLAVGGEHRRLTDETQSTKTKTIKQLNIGQFTLSGNWQDNLGAGAINQFSVQSSVGNLAILSADAKAIDLASAKTSGNYYKWNANLSRTQYFNPKWSLYTGVSLQWANKNLDSGEQFSLGGEGAVSAYHANDFSVDKGIIGQAELRYALNKNLSLSGFYDIAQGKLRNKPFVSGKNRVNLQGGGVGLYANYKGVSLQTKVAWKTSSAKTSNNRHPQIWLNVGYRF